MPLIDRIVKMLLPKEDSFFDLLERGADCAVDAAIALEAICTAPTSEARTVAIQKLQDIEHRADAVIHETYDALNRTFVTPIDRTDIYTLATDLEEVVDLHHATAMQTEIHAIQEMPNGTQELVSFLQQATQEMRAAVRILRNMKGLEQIRVHARNLSNLEHQGDDVFRSCIKNLFRHEKDAVRLIQHKEFLEGLERTLDACDHLGTALMTVVIKNG